MILPDPFVRVDNAADVAGHRTVSDAAAALADPVKDPVP
jgi:hypothetical protein